jgi:uncharacterized membrane protein
MGGGIASWIPSLQIALSTVAAFAIGRALAWAFSGRPRIARALRAVVLVIALAVAVYFYLSPSSRYALLLPAAFLFGHWSYGHTRMARGIFD